jgi:hypothetical protein
MTEENVPQGGKAKGGGGNIMAGRLAAVGWGLFFIWIGVVFLQEYSAAVGLLGVGIITLIMQIWRKFAGLVLEGFWIVIGLLFVIGGLWAVFEVNIPLIPVALIISGLILILSVLRRQN